MAEDEEDCNGLEMTILTSLGSFLKIHKINDDIAPLIRRTRKNEIYSRNQVKHTPLLYINEMII